MPQFMISFNCLPQGKDSVQVNTVKVLESDNMATNGVIHFVKQLLLTEGKNFFH